MRALDRVIALVLLIVIVCPSAFACSCPPKRESSLGVVQQALNEAEWVFVAKIREVRQYDHKPDGPAGNPDPRYFSLTEEVRFVVLEVFKGDLFVGQPVLIRQEIARGLCAMSARNDPLWIEEIVSPEVSIPASISDTWLIYSSGPEPFDLNSCARTTPVNFLGAKQDLEFLRELQKKVRWKSPTVSHRPR